MNKITELRKRAAYLRQLAFNARDIRIKQQYARDAGYTDRLADQHEREQIDQKCMVEEFLDQNQKDMNS